MANANNAVEITKSADSIDIWVDANNNGVRDDDDVNIFVTASGGLYTTSPTFRHALDATIQNHIKQLAVMLLTQPQTDEALNAGQQKLRDLALELVVRATTDAAPTAPAADAIAPVTGIQIIAAQAFAAPVAMVTPVILLSPRQDS